MRHRIFLAIAMLAAAAAHAEDVLEEAMKRIAADCASGVIPAEQCPDVLIDGRQGAVPGEETPPRWFCNYFGESTAPPADLALLGSAFSQDTPVDAAVNEIIAASGLQRNFIVLPAPVPNAMAEVRGSDRYILYNVDFLDDMKRRTGTNWSVYSVMAHELGHHLEGHTLKPGGSRPDLELEADSYSGWLVAKLGASLDEAQIAMATLGSPRTSSTHPARDDRLTAIEEGWRKAAGTQGSTAPPPAAPSTSPGPDPGLPPRQQPTPPPRPRLTDECTVNGRPFVIDADGRVHQAPVGSAPAVAQKQACSPLCWSALMTQGTRCAFEMLADGSYCVDLDGRVFGAGGHIGQCRPL
jgi:hypothetical protein